MKLIEVIVMKIYGSDSYSLSAAVLWDMLY